MATGVNGLEKVYKFSQDGFFANQLGDFCARATAKLLKIPILIITIVIIRYMKTYFNIYLSNLTLFLLLAMTTKGRFSMIMRRFGVQYKPPTLHKLTFIQL